jgi:ammonia channel protein AmtB
MSEGGRESQSMAFFMTPGIELLYSGVTRSRPAEAAILSFRSATAEGMPLASSRSPS